jgi:hypothetical protein
MSDAGVEYDLTAGSGGTVTSVSSLTTDQLTVADGTTDAKLSIITGAVVNGGTALATGDQIYDFVQAEKFTNADETDQVFTASEAFNIDATDITNLGNLSGTNTGDQDISGKLDLDGGNANQDIDIGAFDFDADSANFSGGVIGQGAFIGDWSFSSDFAIWSAVSKNTMSDYAIVQHKTTGGLFLNSEDAITFQNLGTNKAIIDADISFLDDVDIDGALTFVGGESSSHVDIIGIIRAKGADGRIALEDNNATTSIYVRNGGASGQRQFEVNWGSTNVFKIINNHDAIFSGNSDAASFSVGGSAGATGTFTTVTVVNGIVISGL